MSSLSVAIPLPKNIKSQLQRLCYGLPAAKWIESENFHLKLLTLGEVDGNALLDIDEKLVDIRTASFPLVLQGLNWVPANDALWLGIAPCEALDSLRKIIDNKIKEISGLKAHRNFPPHVTLAHYEKADPKRLGVYLETFADFAADAFQVESFILIESKKTLRQHTIYIEQARYTFVKDEG